MKQHPSHTPEDPRRRSGSGFISGLILELKNILHDYGTMQLLGLLLLLIKHTASSELIWNIIGMYGIPKLFLLDEPL